MLTAVLSCALLLALPAMQGAQMSLAPPEGIRRPDQALFPELSGQCGRGWVWVGPGPLATNYSARYEPSFSLPNPRLGGGCFAHGGGEVCVFCPHIAVPGLGLQPGLKRTTAEQAGKALLQEAKDNLAEVTVQGNG